MPIRILGAREHNLKNVDAEIPDGITVVTGVSGSGKSSLVFDTLHREADRYFSEMFVGASAPGGSPALVDHISGVGPTVAIGQDLLNRNPQSTLATFAGLHPLLRLLFTRFGARFCPTCGEEILVWQEEDVVFWLAADDSARFAIVVQNTPGRHRALLEELRTVFGEMRVRVDGRWLTNRTRLSPAAPHEIAIAFDPTGGDARAARAQLADIRALGANVIAIGDRRIGISPVCAACNTWISELEAVHFKMHCALCGGEGCDACGGTGLHPAAAGVRWESLHLPELLGRSVDEIQALVEQCGDNINDRLRHELTIRLGALQRAGLGYLALNRTAPSLSRGEGQRVRLAVALVSRLEEIVHIFDEPTIGLHPSDIKRLMQEIRSLPGPVIYVEHDRRAAAEADHSIDIGPDAGPGGGEITFTGTPRQLWEADTISGRYFSLRDSVALPAHRETPSEFIEIRHASLHNLREIDVSFARARLNVVTGVSGSGKSTLVGMVLVRSLLERKAIGCREIIGADMRPVIVDQSPIGKNPRSNPATYTKLADILRDAFANATDLSASHFTFNRNEGACPECEGMGAIEMKMRYLPSNWITCAACRGQRFTEEVLQRVVAFGDKRLSIAAFLDLSVDAAWELFSGGVPLPETKRKAALRILEALSDTGLGYLSLGQPSPSLSGGEAQRVKLAKYLGSRALKDKLLVLDEPTTGLHPRDVSGLMVVLDRLVREGATIVVIEHNLDVVAGADWIVDLGPGSGPNGGELLFQGPLPLLRKTRASLTAHAMQEERRVRPRARAASLARGSRNISVRGAAAHNLKRIDVDLPKGRFTVVTGVSGSGKSSLVRDVLEVEARRRYLESLTMYERQAVQEGEAGEVDSVTGLGVTLPLAGQRRYRNPRLTVGTATDITHHLAALMSLLGDKRCGTCARKLKRRNARWICTSCGDQGAVPEPRHFIPHIYGSACTTCQGLGMLRAPNVDKLIVAPEKPLCAGAMYSPGFYPQGMYSKPFNSGYDQLQALAAKHGFDPFQTPWREMPGDARNTFLYGNPEPLTVTYISRKGRIRKSTHPFPGVFQILGNWDQGGTYTDPKPCPACNGARLRPENLAVTLDRHNMHDLCTMPLSDLLEVCGQIRNSRDPGLQRLLTKLELLNEIGLGYLHLDRRTPGLSAGEAQRVGLVKVIASGLTGLTVLLDEPSRGMHPREVGALNAMIARITALGNTVVVVEHDPAIILAADHVIDLGPGAGTNGGEVIATGSPLQLQRKRNSVTGKALKRREVPQQRTRRQPGAWMTIVGARENNLDIKAARIPLGVLAGVCGVSGSGKSSLVIDTLARVVAPRKQTTSVAREVMDPGDHDRIEGAPERCIQVDQSREGIISPLSYLGLMNPLLKHYVASDVAQALALDEKTLAAPCSACKGSGVTRIDMGFLPDEHSQCEACRGSGYREEIRQIVVRGHSIPDLLSLTVAEVYGLWRDDPRLEHALGLLKRIGLGYLVLSQPARSLSGGEIQRLKIARELGKRSGGNTLYLLDEPTTGLHLTDVGQLLDVLRELVDRGNSVLVIEHHIDVLAACDWLIELGPGGGPDGGRIVAEGTPEHVARSSSPTSRYLKELLP